MDVPMTVYDNLWILLEQKGISKYELHKKHSVSKSQIHRLRKNENVQMNTLDKICNILKCDIGEVATHIHDDNIFG